MADAAIPLHYTEALIRGAVQAWWWRGRGALFWTAAAGAAAALGVLLWIDPTGGWTLTLFALATLAFGVAGAAYLVPLQRSLRVVRAMDSGRATLHLRENGLEVESAAGRASVPWTTVAVIVETSETWLLICSRSSFSTLPLADLPSEARVFIAEHVRRAGGTVRD